MKKGKIASTAYKQAQQVVQNLKFYSVLLHKKAPPISPNANYNSHNQFFQEKMQNYQDQVLDGKKWHEKTKNNILFAEEQDCYLSQISDYMKGKASRGIKGFLQTPDAVSYTHLDVYKRQTIYRETVVTILYLTQTQPSTVRLS